jgi:hypothetical protein
MTEGWEEMVGGDLEFIPDWDEMLARALELIDAKREALKLKPYDPAQFGDSGDSPYFAAIRAYLAEKAEEAARGVETVDAVVYPLAEGHSHDHGAGDAHGHGAGHSREHGAGHGHGYGEAHGHGDDAGPLHAHGQAPPAGHAHGEEA